MYNIKMLSFIFVMYNKIVSAYILHLSQRVKTFLVLYCPNFLPQVDDV